mgnify:CR=1 FL=1
MFKLLKPAKSWIEILDQHGAPVSGCSLYRLKYIDPNGKIYANGRVSTESQDYSLRMNMLEVIRKAIREWNPAPGS